MTNRVLASLIVAAALGAGCIVLGAPGWAAGGFGSLAYLVVVHRP